MKKYIGVLCSLMLFGNVSSSWQFEGGFNQLTIGERKILARCIFFYYKQKYGEITFYRLINQEIIPHLEKYLESISDAEEKKAKRNHFIELYNQCTYTQGDDELETDCRVWADKQFTLKELEILEKSIKSEEM